MNRQSWAEGIVFLILQFTGAIVASGFVFIQLAEEQSRLIVDHSVLGIPVPGSSAYDASVLMGEMIAGMFLGFAYMAVYGSGKDSDACKNAATIGTTVFLLLLTMTEAFGVGLNPARSLAPAIMAGRIGHLQLGHLLGPIVGCLLGAVVQSSVFSEDDDDEELFEGDSVEKKQIVGHENYTGEVELREQTSEVKGN
jgi:glycerol uptake facilitator-like aquaporin